MKAPSHLANNSGSVLVAALLMAMVLGITLGSYMMWVGTQNVLTRESHAWNAALVVAEAGIEEGMAHINSKFSTNAPLNANGWSGPTGGFYRPQETRVLLSGSVTNGWYNPSVSRDPTTQFPIVYSTGYTMVPLVGRPIARVIEVKTGLSPAFNGAMAAREDIKFNGTTINIDSYDSMDSNHSTPTGMYDPVTRKANGHVASNYGFVNVGNANVYGTIRTGPYGTYNVGPTGKAGDLNWAGPGIQPGWYINDFNADFPEAALPDDFVKNIQPTGAGTNIYVLSNGDYTLSSLTMQPNDHVLVTGVARLWVTGDIDMRGKASFEFETEGASLTIYMQGASGAFTQINTKGNANSFKYFGLPSNTSLSWSGNANYVGTIYAPQASFTLGGGGSDVMDYQGACVVKSVIMNGKFNFHYDEALARRGPMTGYYAKSWSELPPPAN